MESPWISAIVIVNFEIEKGQTVEAIHPSEFKLSDEELRNMSFMSFPDTTSKKESQRFHFRLRSTHPLNNQLIEFNKECKSDIKANTGHLMGYVYFRQVKDPKIFRGYFQKSFVILSHLSFINFFYELVSRWGKMYFENEGLPFLVRSFNEVLQWPNISANKSFRLSVLGTTYQFFLPAETNNRTQQQNLSLTSCGEDSTNNNRLTSTPMVTLTSVNEIDIFGAIHILVNHLQFIWELVLLGEPILVISTTATDSSILVQSLASIISPLEYYPEIFPYFTIHNEEFHEFANSSRIPSGILGCTNPYFAKTLSTMHIIKINESLQSGNDFPIPHQKFEKVKSIQKLMTDSSNSFFYTQYKPFLTKDKQLIKKILNGVKTRRPSGVQSIILRRSFEELTQSFMIPLERYMTSLMPLLKDISAFRAPPSPAQFNEDNFLATLETSGPQLTSTIKGDYDGLYRKFFASPNFRGWYSKRRNEQLKALEELHQEAIAKEDFSKWICGKQEVEIVDMILCIKNKLQLPANSNSTLCLPSELSTQNTLRSEIKDLLLKKLNDLISSLPDDLKTILI